MQQRPHAGIFYVPALSCALVLFLSISPPVMSREGTEDTTAEGSVVRLVTNDWQADSSGSGPGNRSDSWKERFESICSQTTIATSLSAEQLRKLVSESDELLNQLMVIEEPSVKVYIFRLGKCRDLFQFALDWQEASQQGDSR